MFFLQTVVFLLMLITDTLNTIAQALLRLGAS